MMNRSLAKNATILLALVGISLLLFWSIGLAVDNRWLRSQMSDNQQLSKFYAQVVAENCVNVEVFRDRAARLGWSLEVMDSTQIPIPYGYNREEITKVFLLLSFGPDLRPGTEILFYFDSNNCMGLRHANEE